MTPKRQRLLLVAGGVILLTGAAFLVMAAFRDNIVFFYSPTEVSAQAIDPGRRLRLGGLVEEGSVRRSADASVEFRVTDLSQTVAVRYHGLLPDLFREGQGVIAEGSFDGAGTFVATEVLAKHDEEYMPPEVAEALRKSGRWQESGGRGGPKGTTP